MRKVDGAVFRDLAARAAVGALFVMLSWNFLADFLRTGRGTGLLFLVSEALVGVLAGMRRRAQAVDRSALAAALTTISLLGPPFVRPADVPPLAPDVLTACVSIIGVLVVIAGKVTIG